MNTLAIDVGGTKFQMAVFEENSRMIQKERRETDREGGKEWMLSQITAIIREWAPEYRFQRCGIGFGGPVHFDEQRIAMSTHVGGWSNVFLSDVLADELGFRPIMDNDANVGALGEGHFGAGRGFRPLFYMTLSTGIGGGILTEDSRIYRGADSYAGELGHVTLYPGGKDCLCGSQGCFERMCSGLWLERDYGRSAKDLLADPEFVKRYVIDLARGLKAPIMILNPARIVIGGGMAKAGEPLFGPLREELRGQVPAGWSHARIDVVPAALGDDSVLWGAFALAKTSAS